VSWYPWEHYSDIKILATLCLKYTIISCTWFFGDIAWSKVELDTQNMVIDALHIVLGI
jgi:hypothetical protein